MKDINEEYFSMYKGRWTLLRSQVIVSHDADEMPLTRIAMQQYGLGNP